MSKLNDRLNDPFGTEFTQADQLFFDQMEEAAISDEDLPMVRRIAALSRPGACALLNRLRRKELCVVLGAAKLAAGRQHSAV